MIMMYYTGVGKVLTLYKLTTHFGKYGSYIPYSMVINYGTPSWFTKD